MEIAGELSARERPVGGPLSATVTERPAGFARGRSRLLVLIHGYNNTEDAARKSYEAFVGNLGALGGRVNTGTIAAFFGPGDAGLGFLSGASYPWGLKPATDSGARLVDFLNTLAGPGGGPVEIWFVCHSLGNRVGLELLRLVAAGRVSGTVVERGTCLMAAAVPVFMAADGGRLDAAARATRTLALNSPDDIVLRLAFPLGQTAAGEGFFPEAIGRNGNPTQRWGARMRMFKEPGAGYGHSDYWPNANTAPELARFLGAVVPNAIAESAVTGRALPAAGEVTAAGIAARGLAARPVFG